MLTSDQLSAIDRHLRKENGLLNEDLIAELTDHYVAGIENRLTQGIEFDVAIQEIHAGFGGRKGLLKMEEDFQQSQAKNNSRIIRNTITSYFRLPRLSFTFLILTLVYGSIQLLPVKLASALNDKWLFIVLMGGLGIVYVLAFFQLVTGPGQTSRTKAFYQLMWLMKGVNAISVIVIQIYLRLPVNQLIVRYPLFASVVITVFLVVEIATIELLVNHFYKNRTIKSA